MTRRLVSGDGTFNIQANAVYINFPSFNDDIKKNPVRTLDESLHVISGLKASSFIQESSEALEKLYQIYNFQYQNKISKQLLASLTEALALVQMDMGNVIGGQYSAIPLFLKASQIWKETEQNYRSLYDIHMMGVSAGIAGRNDRAIKIYEACRNSIPKGSRFKILHAHVTRDLGIALNRNEQYEQAFKLLGESRTITKYWHSEFNFGLDSQKLAIAAAGNGNYDLSYVLLEEASKILDEKDDLTYVKGLNAKHFFAVKINDNFMAKKLFDEIIDICDRRSLTHQKKVVIMQSTKKKTC